MIHRFCHKQINKRTIQYHTSASHAASDAAAVQDLSRRRQLKLQVCGPCDRHNLQSPSITQQWTNIKTKQLGSTRLFSWREAIITAHDEVSQHSWIRNRPLSYLNLELTYVIRQAFFPSRKPSLITSRSNVDDGISSPTRQVGKINL